MLYVYNIAPGADLCEADLSGADLRHVDLRGADLSFANLRDTNLRGANLSLANLESADFRDADLSYADMSSANLTGANLRRTNRHRLNLENADTTDARIPCDDCGCVECECIHCGRCGDTVEDTCDNCDRGTDCGCCSCIYCEGCNSRVSADYWCSEGEHCEGCCEGHEERFEHTEPSRVWEAPRGECARLAGVEYETTEEPGSAGMGWARKWGAGWHEDGSCGYEAVTPPCAGSHIDRCLDDLSEVIGKTDNSCGIHVHVDASDYKWDDLYRFLRVFGKVEGLLYVLGGQQRITNSYCEPCGVNYLAALDSDDPKNAVLALAYGVREKGEPTPRRRGKKVVQIVPRYGKQANRDNPGKKTGGRYKSINIAPWVFGRRLRAVQTGKGVRRNGQRRDTTLEFRLHRNGDGAERVIGWTHLCVAIVEWCARASDAEVRKLPKSALRALCTIAPASKVWILRRVTEWRVATRIEPGKNAIRRVDPRTWTIKVNATYCQAPVPIWVPERIIWQHCDCGSCVQDRAREAALNALNNPTNTRQEAI